MKKILSSQLEEVVGGRMKTNGGSGGRAKSFSDRNHKGSKSGTGTNGGGPH